MMTLPTLLATGPIDALLAQDSAAPRQRSHESSANRFRDALRDAAAPADRPLAAASADSPEPRPRLGADTDRTTADERGSENAVVAFQSADGEPPQSVDAAPSRSADYAGADATTPSALPAQVADSAAQQDVRQAQQSPVPVPWSAPGSVARGASPAVPAAQPGAIADRTTLQLEGSGGSVTTPTERASPPPAAPARIAAVDQQVLDDALARAGAAIIARTTRSADGPPIVVSTLRNNLAPRDFTAGRAGTPVDALSGLEARPAGVEPAAAGAASGDSSASAEHSAPDDRGERDFNAGRTTPAESRAGRLDAALRLEHSTGLPVDLASWQRGEAVRSHIAASPAPATSADAALLTSLGADLDGGDEAGFAGRVVRGLSAMLNQRGGVMTMRLDPPELGQLRIQMTIARGVVSASFEPANQQAHDLISRNLATLRQSLESQGLIVERLHTQPPPPAPSHSMPDDGRGDSSHRHGGGESGRERQEPQGDSSPRRDGRAHREFAGLIHDDPASMPDAARRPHSGAAA